MYKVFILLIYFGIPLSAYEIPEPVFKVLNPKGIEISIPDEKDVVKNVVFNIDIDGYMHIMECISSPTAGLWKYVDNNILLEQNKSANYTVSVTGLVSTRCQTTTGSEICQREANFAQRFSFNNTDKSAPTSSEKPIILPMLASRIFFDPDDEKQIQEQIKNSPLPTPKTTDVPQPIVSTTSSPPTKKPTSTCKDSVTSVRGRDKTCREELIFEDNFDWFDKSKWEYEIRFPLDTEDAAFVSYQDLKDNLFLKDGNLNIVPGLSSTDNVYLRTGKIEQLKGCTPKDLSNRMLECSKQAEGFTILPPITTAKIRTKSSFVFTYGKIEIRAKFPKGDWIFPELYLESYDNKYGVSQLASGRMVIGQIRSNNFLETRENTQIGGDTLQAGVLISNNATLRDSFMQSNTGDTHYGNDFHIYTLIWEPNKITALVDGDKYANIKGDFRKFAQDLNLAYSDTWDSDNKISPFNKAFYISLSVSVGGILTFPDDSETGVKPIPKPWSNTSPKAALNFNKKRNDWLSTWKEPTLEIDYVRVYSL